MYELGDIEMTPHSAVFKMMQNVLTNSEANSVELLNELSKADVYAVALGLARTGARHVVAAAEGDVSHAVARLDEWAVLASLDPDVEGAQQ